MMTCVRHNRTVPFVPNKFGPKEPDHPSCYHPCPLCGDELVPGDYTTLIPLGPGDDQEARERSLAGRWYNAIAVEVHWECAGIPEPS